MTYDLVICIRCHTQPELVADTISSVRAFTNPATTRLMIGVDANNKALAHALASSVDGVWVSARSCGWGAGLYTLLNASLLYAIQRWSFSHFMSIDYDTLFIDPGVDAAALSRIDNLDIGLVGHFERNSKRWATCFQRDKVKIERVLGEVPTDYYPGEGVQGGCFVMTRSLINALTREKMLQPPWTEPKAFTTLADDHIIPLYCRYCGLQIQTLSKQFYLRWQLDKDPCSLHAAGVLAFHPTKVKPGRGGTAVEIGVRNYYRKRRGLPLLGAPALTRKMRLRDRKRLQSKR